jgi:hypothetical protein
MVTWEAKLPKMDGVEIHPGVKIIGEPAPVPGTDKLRCLANVLGSLCVVELRIKFREKDCGRLKDIGGV